jgi:broad specificity phosphatase PhoE
MADVVWVVRHGERRDTVDPDWDSTAERVHDPPLTELGRWAAWRVGRRFVESEQSFDAVYASPFLRAVETADEICRELGAEFRLEPGLGEHRNPEWFDAEPEILPREHLAGRFETVCLDHEPQVIPAFPETHAEAIARVGETTRRLVAENNGAVLLVGHGLTIGGVVDGLVGSTEGVEAPLCGLTRLVSDGEGWQLDCSGDTAHLDQ